MSLFYTRSERHLHQSTEKMRLQRALLAAIFCAVASAASVKEVPQTYAGNKVYQVRPTVAQLALLQRFEGAPGYDFWSRGRVANVPMDIMVAPENQAWFVAFLRIFGIKNTILVNDVQTVVNAEKTQQQLVSRRLSTRITHNKYYRYDEIVAYLDEMAAKYPTFVKVETIGKSFENRNLKVLTISKGPNNPAVWVDSGIHAREWIAPSMALYIIDQLLENPANSDLINGLNWHIMPSVNPDGYEHSHTKSRLWRKTRNTVVSKSCPGVDANRNFNFHWMEVGASNSPCADTYGGPSAFSEPETLAVSKFLTNHKSTIKLYLTFHSYGNYILYPWGYTSALPSDWKTLDALAVKANAAQLGADYTIGSSTNVLYAAAGGSDDWAKGVAGIALSYTIELPGGGPNGFDPPASSISKIVRDFFPAVRVYGEYIRDTKI